MAGLEDFVRRAEKAEKEIENLKIEIKLALKNGHNSSPINDEKVPEELERLRIENSKLTYRIGILKRATESEQKRG
jgi:hypothetical protein